MDDITVARALHVLAIVHWIGGVSMMTAVTLPAVTRSLERSGRLALFEAIEGRFARQARVSVTVAGLTGLYMTHRLAAWDRFLDPGYWWMHAMVLVWAIFTIALFVVEPLGRASFRHRTTRDPEASFGLVQRAHWVLLAISAATIGAAVLGAHGMLY